MAKLCLQRMWCAAMVTTPIWWWPRIRARRPFRISPMKSPMGITSGSAMPLLPVAAMVMTTRLWVLPLAVPGWRCSGTSARLASTYSSRTLRWWASAIWAAMCLAMACCYPSIFGWCRRLIICIFLSIRTPMRPALLSSVSGCLIRRAVPGTILIVR